MPIDRDATLKKAEKLLRQGKLAGAIEEYVRLVADQPRDWNSVNALGDLYVRAGEADRAVAQFTTVADHLFGEGFLPRAAALYKKALKVKADDDHTLERLIDIADRQGLMADAKAYLRELSRHRANRGDRRGVIECDVRLATLADADPDAKLMAARTLHTAGEHAQAAAMFVAAADQLTALGRSVESTDALFEALKIDTANGELCRRVVRECLAAGQIDRARPYLDALTAGDSPDLLLALARLEFSAGRDHEAHTHLSHLLTIAPDRTEFLIALADELMAAGHLDSAFVCVDVVADAALAAGHAESAVSVLQSFTGRQRHLSALTRLVEIAVDAGDESLMRDAQAQLADVYLDAGRGVEARVIAEDLVAQEPDSDAHARRLRRALELLGGAPPEPELAEDVDDRRLMPVEAALDDVDLGDVEDLEADADLFMLSLPAESLEEPGTDEPRAVAEPLEVDLSATIAALRAQALVLPPMPGAMAGDTGKKDVEVIFDELRSRVSREHQVKATEQYERGVRNLERGRLVDAIGDLQAAARTPILRFRAAASLGRVLASRGEWRGAVDWLERAAEAPPPTADEGRALLYDLADALERLGEPTRALAVFMELEADASAYRDVRERTTRLSQPGSTKA